MLSMAVFIAGYLVQAAASIVVGVRLFSVRVVAAVLLADCGAHHLSRAADGEWWMFGDAYRLGVGLWIVNFVTHTIIWIIMHACPLLGIRNPFWTGPHTTARIVVCSLLECVAVVVFALLLPDHADTSARRMALWVCLPALGAGMPCATLAIYAPAVHGLEERLPLAAQGGVSPAIDSLRQMDRSPRRRRAAGGQACLIGA